ncbi:protein-disulfide reductase DsbD [Moraxella catarrhalis]|nr:protein-disulfide reductase DsbD [Moraxella catarrhalis]
MSKLKNCMYSIALGASIVSTASVGTTMPAAANNLASLFGGASQPKFLPVHEAFQVSASQMDDELVVSFQVTPKHYIYQERLSLKLPNGVSTGQWVFDKTPTIIDDPTFGVVPVFEENVTARVKLSTQSTIDKKPVEVRWQGCAKAGLCYPPEITTAQISLEADKSAAPTTKAKPSPATKASVSAEQNLSQTPTLAAQTSDQSAANDTNSEHLDDQSKLDEQPVAPDIQASDDETDDLTQAEIANDVDQKFALDHTLPEVNDKNLSPILMIGFLFLAGILLAFTPCVYPMIPIVANIVARQHAKSSAKRGFVLSSAYGVGVATAYGMLGALIAWFGQALGIATWLQRVEVLLVAALLFVFFAIFMFGWIQLRLPSVLSNTLSAKSQAADSRLGTIGGSYLSGLLSALVVSPCVSAPMAGALTVVAASGNVIFGFLALFALGIGISMPLIVMGTAQGKWMPKSGAWMQHIRSLGGFLLLGVALLLIERIVLSTWMLGLWMVWFVALAAWLFVSVGQSRKIFKLLAVIPATWAVVLAYGMIIGANDAWRPWHAPSFASSAHQDIKIDKLAELDGVLAAHDKVLVDVTADWCIECRIMERTLFTNRPREMADYQVVKLDISETTEDSRAILARYQLFGPPALLIYHQGKLDQVLLGETKLDTLKDALAR